MRVSSNARRMRPFISLGIALTVVLTFLVSAGFGGGGTDPMCGQVAYAPQTEGCCTDASGAQIKYTLATEGCCEDVGKYNLATQRCCDTRRA